MKEMPVSDGSNRSERHCYKVVRLAVILIAVFEFVSGEEGWLANGRLSDEAHRQAAYVWEMAVVVLTLVSLPLSYHFRERGKRLVLPLVLLSLTAFAGILAYYLTWRNTGLLCAACVLIMLFYITAKKTNHDR